VAQALFAAVAGVCGAGVAAEVTPSWSEPLVLWQALLGGPSSGKSPALAAVHQLLVPIEDALRRDDDKRHGRHVARAEQARQRTERWREECHQAAEMGAVPPPMPPESTADHEFVPARIMVETSSDRLSARGGPHFGSPDKVPARRLETLAAAGEERVPFTTGILIGIGESRAERIDALLAIRELAERYGHVQEVIVQNFRAKPGTRMAAADEPPPGCFSWVARLLPRESAVRLKVRLGDRPAFRPGEHGAAEPGVLGFA
jgi:hypothetical protein